jgi:uncharacterized repeat protein (TIGR03806 family)
MKRSSTRERGLAPANSSARGHSLHEEPQASMGLNESRPVRGLLILAGAVTMAACGSAGDGSMLYEPWIAGPGPRQPAFLGFPGVYDGRGPAPVGATGFPKLLSQTGAFADTESLQPASGILPYEIQVPLWSDGATKRRWISVPEDTPIGFSADEHFDIPVGSVFVKHFEMALDERFPERRSRLETRVWVAARSDAQYGVTYKWNADQTDAELLIAGETEELTIVGADGEQRTQPYFYPGPADCQGCHNAQAGFVLGVRAAQLNREVSYRLDRPPIDQLSAWSEWGLIDRRIDVSISAQAPRLAAVADEQASLEDRVRSYWDGNCAMCHAGADGVVPGWDARFSTALDDQGLAEPPQNPRAPATRLIEPGSPEQSLIYVRGDTAEVTLRMPPLGRNRVDDAYIELLGRWIASLEAR